MRLLLLLLIPLFLFSNVNAQVDIPLDKTEYGYGNHKAKLTFSVESTDDYVIKLGYDTYQSGGRFTVINGLQAGTYNLKIYKNNFNSRPQIIYEGSITIPSNKKLFALVTSYGRLELYEQVNNDYEVTGHSNIDISELKRALIERSFDNSRIDLLGITIKGSTSFSSSQVSEILHIFDFDNSRLEAAKLLYPYIYDKGNAFMLLRAFDFDSNGNALADWIKTYNG